MVTLGIVFSFYVLLFCSQVICIEYISLYKKANKTKIKMTNLDPKNMQLPPTFLFLPVCSLTQIKRFFFFFSFPLTRSSPFCFVSTSCFFASATLLRAFSSQPSPLMRRKLAGLPNPHASSPNELHGGRAPPERWVMTWVERGA